MPPPHPNPPSRPAAPSEGERGQNPGRTGASRQSRPIQKRQTGMSAPPRSGGLRGRVGGGDVELVGVRRRGRFGGRRGVQRRQQRQVLVQDELDGGLVVRLLGLLLLPRLVLVGRPEVELL